MSLLHPVLLGLLGLVAVPVILHFLMRQKPKKFLFPALRLIEMRRKTNVRRLRLRHIWLLLLRIAIIALLVIAIARPLVPAANYGLTTSELLKLVGVVAVAVTAYFAAVQWWGKRTPAHHEFLYRRSVARAVTGAAAVLLVLLLVAWPYARRVSAEVADPSQVVAEDRPVAAVFLFDTSRSMDYQFEGASRLDVAKRIALAHLSTLPAGSRVAISDSANQAPVIFQADLAGARERIEALETHPVHTALDQRTRATFDLQAQDRNQGFEEQSQVPEKLRRDPFVRAVYVFTDLAASAWQGPTSQTLKSRLEQDKWLQFYIVDVGVEQPTNIGIVAAQPTEEVAVAGARVTIEADFAVVGNAKDTAVDLYVNGDSGPVKQGQVTLKAEPGTAGRAEFVLPDVKPPMVQGELRVVRSDPLSADDVRHFTVAVQAAPKLLIVSDRLADAFLWEQALEACGYDVTKARSSSLANTKLADYDVVYLLNVANVAEQAWPALTNYVTTGGGLGVLLGAPVESLSYNSEAAQAILPAELLTHISFPSPEFFRPTDEGHPIFAAFSELAGGFSELTNRDVRRHYIVRPSEGSSVVATYTFDRDTRPALVARTVSNGRVAMVTTGVDADGWSELPNADFYVIFTDQLTRFLAGRTGGRRNYSTGEEAVLRLGRDDVPQKLLLRTPKLGQRPIDVPKDGRRLVVGGLDEIGHYELFAVPGEPKATRGFSVDLPASESDLQRLTNNELDARFGEDRYSLARDGQRLAAVVRDTTLGAELMPYVLMVLVAVFCGEHLVANRFYDAEQNPQHR